MAFPSIGDPQIALLEKSVTATLRTPFEAGYVQTRARYTRVPRRWELSWNYLSSTDYGSLRTHFEDTVVGGGDSFGWTHPKDASTHTVRYADDELTFLATQGIGGLNLTAQCQHIVFKVNPKVFGLHTRDIRQQCNDLFGLENIHIGCKQLSGSGLFGRGCNFQLLLWF